MKTLVKCAVAISVAFSLIACGKSAAEKELTEAHDGLTNAGCVFQEKDSAGNELTGTSRTSAHEVTISCGKAATAAELGRIRDVVKRYITAGEAALADHDDDFDPEFMDYDLEKRIEAAKKLLIEIPTVDSVLEVNTKIRALEQLNKKLVERMEEIHSELEQCKKDKS